MSLWLSMFSMSSADFISAIFYSACVGKVVKFIRNTRNCIMPWLPYVMHVPFLFHFLQFQLQEIRKYKQTHSMCQWFPRASFPSVKSYFKKSVTHAVNPLLPCDHQFSILWLACEDEHRCAATSPANKHCKEANIPFSVPQSVWTSIGRILFSSTAWRKKLAGITGLLLLLQTLSHIILLENPSTQPCIGSPDGFSLSYPSTCHEAFGPGETYDRRWSFLDFRSADASGSKLS